MKKKYIIFVWIFVIIITGILFAWWWTSEDANSRTRTSEERKSEAYSGWLKTEYLNYFEIEEGFHIIDNFRASGAQLDFIIYDIQPIDENEWGFHLAIVVIKDGEVFDVIYNRDRWSGNINILEIDVNFDGNMDVIIFMGYMGTQGARTYEIHLQRDDGFSSDPIWISNPILDVENQLILTSHRNAAWSHSRFIYRFIGDELIAVEHLLTEIVRSEEEETSDQYLWYHTILVDGEWQVRESYVTTEGYGYHPDNYWREYWSGDRWQQDSWGSYNLINEAN